MTWSDDDARFPAKQTTTVTLRANLEGANFSGAEMDRAQGLTQSQLNRACGDASTRLPPGLRLPPC